MDGMNSRNASLYRGTAASRNFMTHTEAVIRCVVEQFNAVGALISAITDVLTVLLPSKADVVEVCPPLRVRMLEVLTHIHSKVISDSSFFSYLEWRRSAPGGLAYDYFRVVVFEDAQEADQMRVVPNLPREAESSTVSTRINYLISPVTFPQNSRGLDAERPHMFPPCDQHQNVAQLRPDARRVQKVEQHRIRP